MSSALTAVKFEACLLNGTTCYSCDKITEHMQLPLLLRLNGFLAFHLFVFGGSRSACETFISERRALTTIRKFRTFKSLGYIPISEIGLRKIIL